MMTISLVSGMANATAVSISTPTTISTTRLKTATKSVQVHVAKPAKPKLFVGNPTQAYKLAFAIDDDDNDIFDLDDVAPLYRRKDLQSIKTDATDDNPEGLSEDIQWKLFLARQAALARFRAKQELA
jgi:hypothetical protein